MPKIKSLKETLKKFAKSAAQGASKVTKGISGLTKHSKSKMGDHDDSLKNLLKKSLDHLSMQPSKKDICTQIKNSSTIQKYFKPGDDETKTFKKGSVTGIMIKQLYDYLKETLDQGNNTLKEKPTWLKCKTAESIKKELKKALPVNWTKSVLYDKKVLEALVEINKKIDEIEKKWTQAKPNQTQTKKDFIIGTARSASTEKTPPLVSAGQKSEIKVNRSAKEKIAGQKFGKKPAQQIAGSVQVFPPLNSSTIKQQTKKPAQQMAGSVQVFPAIKQPPPVRTQKSNSQLNTNSSPSNISVKQQKTPSGTQKTGEKGISPKNNGAKKIILSNNRHSLPPTTNQIIDTARSYANDIYNKALNLNVDENLKATFEKIKDKLNTANHKIYSPKKEGLSESFKKLEKFRDALSNILNKLEKTSGNNLTQNIENDVKTINTFLGLDNTSPLTQNQSKNSTATNSKEKVQEDKKTSNATTQANTKTENEPDIFNKLINEDLTPSKSDNNIEVAVNGEKTTATTENINDFLDDILKTL